MVSWVLLVHRVIQGHQGHLDNRASVANLGSLGHRELLVE